MSNRKAMTASAGCLGSSLPGTVPTSVGVCWANKGTFLFTSFNFGQVYPTHQHSDDDRCLVSFQTELMKYSRLRGQRVIGQLSSAGEDLVSKTHTHLIWVFRRRGFPKLPQVCDSPWEIFNEKPNSRRIREVHSSQARVSDTQPMNYGITQAFIFVILWHDVVTHQVQAPEPCSWSYKQKLKTTNTQCFK